jgi:tryptophan synthase beta chain
MSQNGRNRITLSEDRIPKAWYNIAADSPVAFPAVLHPGTGKPIGPADLAPLFPMALIGQEVSADAFIEIPEPVRQVYRLWRPTPLIRARRLEQLLDTPAHIYYKHEGVSPPGSHKPNTAVAQAFFNKEEGVKRISTETGAGQWGSALSFGCQLFGIDCKVFMVRVSYEQKPYRRSMMHTWGATVTPSPSEETESGRYILSDASNSPGSLGIAISEAVEVAAKNEDTKYSLGSVLNHVLIHQTIVGQEALEQMELAGEYPDVIIGCVGGGSNFAGLAYPFLREKFVNGRDARFVAVEPTSCPTLTRGLYAYDFGDTAKLTPLVKMHTLGHTFIPAGIHAGGLRYHGMAPSLCAFFDAGYMEAVAYPQLPVFEAASQFAAAEGLIVAPESAHAVRAAIDEALVAKEAGEARTILFNLSGHGYFDMGAYDAYHAGNLTNHEHPQDAIEEALKHLPQVG